MAEEKTSIFRKKTVESVQSPEVLDSYLRVTTPGVWIFLAAVVCLLAGVIVWSIFGTIESKVNVAVCHEDGKAYCVVPYASFEQITKTGAVTVDGKTYALDDKQYTQDVAGDSTDPRILVVGGFKKGDYVVYITLKEKPSKEGVFAGTVVTETIKPITLLLQ